MAEKLRIVASRCQDLYYGNFKSNSDFFDQQDFQYYCAASANDLYDKLYKEQYAILRKDGEKSELVSFSNDFLSEQFLGIEFRDGEYLSKLEKKVFSFVYDQSSTSIQNVFVINPRPVYELERSDIDEFWMMPYLPITNRIFWALDGDIIRYKVRGKCNIKEVRVVYVPAIDGKDGDVELPDGIVDTVILTTVSNMKQILAGNVIKKSSDQNQNKILQTEMNLDGLKAPTVRENLSS